MEREKDKKFIILKLNSNDDEWSFSHQKNFI